MPKYDKLLILDLDETLIYSSETPLPYESDFQIGDYFVYKRPGLAEFLKTCSGWFELGVWTSSSTDYANEVITQTFPKETELKFIFARERCTFIFNHDTGAYQTVKSLKKIRDRGFSLNKVIVVDDLPETFSRNYGNAVLVSKYLGNRNDNELELLLKYLETLRNVEDIRVIDKRGWRYKV